jgi:hypothetical protein
VSAVAGVPIESIRASLGVLTDKPQRVVDTVAIITPRDSGGGGENAAYRKAQSFVTACIIEKKPFVNLPIELPKLKNTLYDKLCRFALDDYDRWEKGKIYDKLDGDEQKKLGNVIEFPFDDIGGIEKQKEVFDGYLKYLCNDWIDERVKELMEQGGDPTEIAKQIKELKGKKK